MMMNCGHYVTMVTMNGNAEFSHNIYRGDI